jgi:hypothetical protein
MAHVDWPQSPREEDTDERRAQNDESIAILKRALTGDTY